MTLHATLVTAAAFSAAALTLGLSDALGADHQTPNLSSSLSTPHIASANQGAIGQPAASGLANGPRTPQSTTFTYVLDHTTIHIVQVSDSLTHAEPTDVPTISLASQEAAEKTSIAPGGTNGTPTSPVDADTIAGTDSPLTPLAVVAIILLASGAAFVVSGRSRRL